MIRLSLASVGLVEETGSIILVLRADEQARLLIMEIGILEGRAIAMEAEGVKAPRPLTHDLFNQTIHQLGGVVVEAHIRDFQDQTFFATLVLRQADRLLEVDARPSDAIALALRAGAPIYVIESVLATAGVDEGIEEEVPHGQDEEEDQGEGEEKEIIH